LIYNYTKIKKNIVEISKTFGIEEEDLKEFLKDKERLKVILSQIDKDPNFYLKKS